MLILLTHQVLAHFIEKLKKMNDKKTSVEELREFMEEELVNLAWRDATAHGNIYDGRTDKKYEKYIKPWRQGIQKKALNILEKFRNEKEITEDKLIKEIVSLKNYSEKLMQDKIEPLKAEYSCNEKFKFEFRIGQSQKLLNMLLKYYWGMGWLKKHPPHCPIDRNILEEKEIKEIMKAKNGKNATPNWTQMDDIDEYKEYIGYIKEAAEAEEAGLSIAEWELRKWNCLKTKNSKSNDCKIINIVSSFEDI